MPNSIGAFPKGGKPEIGAFESGIEPRNIGVYSGSGTDTNDIGAMPSVFAVTGSGLTLNCSLATLSTAEQAATLITSRIVDAALATLSMATQAATIGFGKTVNCALATLGITANNATMIFSREVTQAAAATLSTATHAATVSLDIIRRIACRLATLTFTTLKADLPFAWMDGVMNEDEWWTRRRKVWSHRKRNNPNK